MHAHRGLRHLAEALAEKQFPVLRFDYDGTGKFRSIEIADDVVSGVCMRFDNVYGTPCEFIGAPAPACDSAPNDDAGI